VPDGSLVSLGGLLDSLTDCFLIPFPLTPRLSPDCGFLCLCCRVTRRIDLSFPVPAVPVAGLLIPFPLPRRSSSECLFRSLCRHACRRIVYFVCLARHADGLLIPFPFPLPPRRSPDCFFLSLCRRAARGIACFFSLSHRVARRIAYFVSLAQHAAGLLFPFPFLPRRSPDCLFLSICCRAARRIACSFRFAAAPLAGLLIPVVLPTRRSPDCLFLTLSHRRAHWITYFVSLAQHTAGLLIPIHFPPCNSVTARASRASGSRNETRTGLGPREGQRAASEQCAASATKTGTRTETKTARSENDTRILL